MKSTVCLWGEENYKLVILIVNIPRTYIFMKYCPSEVVTLNT